MSERKPNEVLISTVLLEKMLALGNESRPFRVIKGPDPEARVCDVRWDRDGVGGFSVVLVYDRPVDKPVLEEIEEIERSPLRVSYTEEMLQDKDLNIRDLVRAKLHTTEIP